MSESELQHTQKEPEKLHQAGKISSIGLSNFLPQHIAPILEIVTIRPVISQIEFHPYLQCRGLLEWYKKEGIVTAAYSSLTAIRKADHFAEYDRL